MNKFVNLTGRLGAFFGLASIVLAAYLVFSRYVLNRPYDWGDEIILMVTLYGVMLSSGELTMNSDHIAVDLIIRKFKGRALFVTKAFNMLVTVSFCAVIAWAGTSYVKSLIALHTRTQTSLGYSSAVIYVMFPLGLGLVGLAGILRILYMVRLARKESSKNVTVNVGEVK